MEAIANFIQKEKIASQRIFYNQPGRANMDFYSILKKKSLYHKIHSYLKKGPRIVILHLPLCHGRLSTSRAEDVLPPWPPPLHFILQWYLTDLYGEVCMHKFHLPCSQMYFARYLDVYAVNKDMKNRTGDSWIHI